MGKMENYLFMPDNLMFKPHTMFVQHYLIASIKSLCWFRTEYCLIVFCMTVLYTV